MTLPVPAFEFQHLFHSRRTVLQRDLLRPDPEAANLYRYVLGRALHEATRPMRLHAAVQMSNHTHEVVFDRLGRDSDYRSHKNSILARALNALRGIKGRVFDTPSRRNREPLLDGASVLAAIVYVIVNPVRANLCDWPHEWPGSVGDWRRILTVPVVASRPTFFFDQRDPEKGGAPLQVRYHLTQPPAFDHLDPADYESLVRRAVEEECRRIHAARERPALGAKRALERPWSHVPTEPDREIASPSYRFIGDPKLVKRLFAEWVAFVVAYIDMRKRWVLGEREGVVFPPGTDRYRHREQAPVARLDSESPHAAWHT